MPQLTNRRAVIPGAGSGIGAAIARAYAAEGARLLLADRNIGDSLQCGDSGVDRDAAIVGCAELPRAGGFGQGRTGDSVGPGGEGR